MIKDLWDALKSSLATLDLLDMGCPETEKLSIKRDSFMISSRLLPAYHGFLKNLSLICQ